MLMCKAGIRNFLLMIVLPVLAACSRERLAPRPFEITAGIEASPSTLDPRLARDAYAVQMLPLVFPGLFEIGDNLEPRPNLVAEYEQADDRTFIFKLKPGIKFANGKTLVSSDVKATLESLRLPELNSPYSELGDRIEGIEILDPLTLKLKLKEPFAPILVMLNLGILPAELATKSSPLEVSELIGAGPYQVEAFEPGNRVALKPNPFYAGAKPYFQRIEFRIIPEDTTRLLSLEKGEIQILQNPIPADELPRLKKNPELRLTEQPGISYTYLGFNFRDPILKDLRVREAIAHAINRDQLIGCLLQGSALKADSLLSPRHWAFEPDVTMYDYDPALAKKMLDQTGLPDPDGDGPRPRFKLLYKTSQNQQRLWIAQAIADELGKVGIEVEVRSLEFGTLFSDIQAGNFSIYTLTWVGVVEPDIYYNIFHSASVPPKGANRGRYSNPALDQILDQARASMSRDERKALYAQVQKTVSHDLPYVSLWYTNDLSVSDQRLEGFALGPGGEWTGLAKARWRP